MQIRQSEVYPYVQKLEKTISDLVGEIATMKSLVATSLTTGGLTLTRSTQTFTDTTTWVLSAAEELTTLIEAAGTTGGATDIEATPTDGNLFFVTNTTGSDIVFKANGETGVTIATTKAAIVVGNGTDFEVFSLVA